ncbi:MAG: tellurite resistance TerB family protein [Synergistaceae bacterium]|nr:tellurite resistance TerB family protein [Synergistaceae bacterium]
MALDFMDLLGSMVQGTMSSSPAASSRMSNAGGGIQDILGSLMGAGQSVTQKVGGDNLAAGGIGALLGTLLGGSKSTTTNALGGGMMGLLGMLAYKALRNSGTTSSTMPTSSASSQAMTYTQPSPQQQAKDAEIILTAMIDAAKADGQVDANEINKIMANLQSSGAGQEGVNYVIQKLQGPMETAKIVAAVKGRPELAAQVYSASLMAIEVDTDAERRYLDKLAKAIGLNSNVINNIEQLTSANSKSYVC